jgi:hypothetical protein
MLKAEQITGLLATACAIVVPIAWHVYTRRNSRQTRVMVSAELIPAESSGALAKVEVRVLNDSDHTVYLQRAEIAPGDVIDARPWRLLLPSEGSVPVEPRAHWRQSVDANEIGLDLCKPVQARVMLNEPASRFGRGRPKMFESKLAPLLDCDQPKRMPSRLERGS